MKEVKKEWLTAYALGELSPTERAEIEEVLQNHPELRREVEEIQNFGNFLSEELKSESLPKMSEKSRGEFIEKATIQEAPIPWWKSLLQGKMLPVGVVMTAFLGVVVFFAVQQEMLQQSADLGEMKGLETSIAVGDGRANQPQLIPEQREEIAANGAPIAKNELKDQSTTEDHLAELQQAKPTSARSRQQDKSGVRSAVVEKKEMESDSLDGYSAAADEAAPSVPAAEPAKLAKSSGGSYLLSAEGKGGGGYGIGAMAQRGSVHAKRLAHPSPGEMNLGYQYQPQSGDSYSDVGENPFTSVSSNPLSTFSIDVDTASYTNIRRYLTQSSMLPPSDAVRIEEMINYFNYDDPAPTGADPFSVNMEVADSPWSEGHKLVRIGIKGKVFPKKDQKTNLVFLVDVSGSMDSPDKLGLLKDGLHKLVEELGEDDHVSLVTYAGHSAVVLDATSADQKKKVHQAIDNLTAEGSTHGSEGISTAYELAQKNFRKEGVNRVILATDGDFNVGTTSDDALVDLVKEKAKKGVFLSVLGFGSGNLNDSMMEKISNNGNGNYYYLDSEKEARKVLVEKLQGTLVTIAKDVKIQVEFNPNNVAEYRLIGYENRKLAAKDFNDDKKDAGEIGAGHTVVALYEIKPKGFDMEGVDALKYQAQLEEKKAESKGKFSDELLTVKLRYKKPNEDTSKLISFPVAKGSRSFASASPDLRWTASVAGFGMMLRNSTHKGTITYDKLIEWANKARYSGKSYDAERAELVELLKSAKRLSH